MTVARFGAVSVVIPTYCSGDWIQELCESIARVLRPMCTSVEIILVDDASPDTTWLAIQRTARALDQVRAIRLMRNEGQATATLCGIDSAVGDLIVTMDDDFQHLPDEIPTLLRVLSESEELDCVFGHFEEKRHAWYRNLGSRVIRAINAQALKLPKNVRSSAFRAFRRSIANAIREQPTANPSLTVLVVGSTSRIGSVAVRHAIRRHGASHYTLAKQFQLAFDSICNASLLPLRAVTVLGFCVSSFAFVLALFYLGRKLCGETAVTGFTTLVVLVLFSTGSTLLALGLLGEYIARILREVRRRPIYFIRETIGEAPQRAALTLPPLPNRS